MPERADPAADTTTPERRHASPPSGRSASRIPESLRVDVLTPAEVALDAALREAWQRRVEASTNIYRLYHSPVWWDHLRASLGDDVLRLIVISAGDGSIRGIVPCELRTHRIIRQIAGRSFILASSVGLDLLGSEPLVDADPDVYAAMVDGLWRVFPGVDLCRLKSLSTSTAFWTFLDRRDHRGTSALAVCDGGRRPFYSIDLEKGWAGYLSRFNAKQRNDLQRKHRLLSSHLGAPLTFRRLTTPDDVRQTYAALDVIAQRARAKLGRALPTEKSLVHAAERGVLRAYLLHGGEMPLAYVIGYQAFDVFHYSDVAYNADSTRSSPGIVLLYHVLKDVCEHEPARWFNFGLGEAEYKRRFSNLTTEDVTVYLFRKTLKNRLRALSLRSLDLAQRLNRVRLSPRTADKPSRLTVGFAGAPTVSSRAESPE